MHKECMRFFMYLALHLSNDSLAFFDIKYQKTRNNSPSGFSCSIFCQSIFWAFVPNPERGIHYLRTNIHPSNELIKKHELIKQHEAVGYNPLTLSTICCVHFLLDRLLLTASQSLNIPQYINWKYFLLNSHTDWNWPLRTARPKTCRSLTPSCFNTMFSTSWPRAPTWTNTQNKWQEAKVRPEYLGVMTYTLYYLLGPQYV